MQATKGDSQPAAQPRITNATFKMPKAVKVMLATIVDPVERAMFKNMMIRSLARPN